MKSNDSIEDRLRRELFSLEQPFKEDKIWADIEKRLEEKKDRKLIWIFLLGASAITLITVFVNLSKYQEIENYRFQVDHGQKINHDMNDGDPCEEGKVNLTKNIEEETLAILNKDVSEFEKHVLKSEKTVTADVLRDEYTSGRDNRSAKHSSDRVDLLGISTSAIWTKNQAYDELNSLKSTLGTEIANEKLADPYGTLVRQDAALINKNMPHLKFNFFSLPELLLNKIEVENKEIDVLKLRPSRYFLQFNTAISRPHINTAARSNDALSAVVADIWDNALSPIVSHKYELKLGVRMTKNWNISTGLEYQEIINKWRSEVIRARVEEILIEKAFFEDDPFGREWYQGFLDQITQVTQIRQSAHKHRLWNLPVYLGYKKNMGKYSIEGNLGCTFALSHQFWGYVLDNTNLSVLKAEDLETDGVISDFGIGLGVSIGLSHDLTERMSIVGSLDVRYQISSWLSDSYPVESKISTYGLGVGLRYGF